MFKKILCVLVCLFYVVNACPEKKEELKKAFSAINEHFKGVVCKKCDGKVGETDAHLKYIDNVVFTKILVQDILGVVVIKSLEKLRPILSKCAKKAMPTEGDFCGEKQQGVYNECLKGSVGEIMMHMDIVAWGSDNCPKIEEYVIKNQKQINKKLIDINNAYIKKFCTGKSG